MAEKDYHKKYLYNKDKYTQLRVNMDKQRYLDFVSKSELENIKHTTFIKLCIDEFLYGHLSINDEGKLCWKE